MKKQYKDLSDYHTSPQDPTLPPFERYISAKTIMARWGMDYIQLRQYPLRAYIQTKPMGYTDYTVFNPYLLEHPDRGKDLKNIEHCQAYTKEDFEIVMYDFYDLAQYEYHHPEIIENPDVCPQLEEELHPTKKKERRSSLATDPKPNEPPNIEKENSAPCDDLTPWVKCAENYCIAQKKEHGQLPTKEEVSTHLEQLLAEKCILLGRHSTLPDAVFRQIWKDIPESCKRKIGEKSK